VVLIKEHKVKERALLPLYPFCQVRRTYSLSPLEDKKQQGAILKTERGPSEDTKPANLGLVSLQNWEKQISFVYKLLFFVI
jgi:hypothetical protein